MPLWLSHDQVVSFPIRTKSLSGTCLYAAHSCILVPNMLLTYMIHISTGWLLDEESRPSFKQLSEELGRMTKDPQRYLVIQNDTDGLSSLPSPTPSEFYKSLITGDLEGTDPNMFMDAEDYLQPMSTVQNYTYQPGQSPFFPPSPVSLNQCQDGTALLPCSL